MTGSIRHNPAFVQDAARVLAVARTGHLECAMTDLVAAQDKYGDDCVIGFVVMLCDTFNAAQGNLEVDPEKPFKTAFVNVETGQAGMNAEDVPREVAWGAALTTARARDDYETFEALLRAVITTADAAEITNHVAALLDATAMTLNTLAEMREAAAHQARWS